MKLLVIGGGGQVGSKIISYAKNKHDMYATYLTRKPDLPDSKCIRFDKTNREASFGLVSKLKPDVVIDTAALHNVRYCENNPDEAMGINYVGTKKPSRRLQ
jgi:dTDP-4-dehydrorhamnose reductase